MASDTDALQYWITSEVCALLRLRRYFFLRRNFVFRLGNTHQPVIKPANDMLQPFDAMPRLAGAGKFVRLVREPHHHGRNLPELQSAKHLLATCAGRCAVSYFA